MKIAYITNCFGSQSHTFIRREVNALRDIGANIRLFGIRADQAHDSQSQNFIDETEYLYPLHPLTLLQANFYFFRKKPLNYFCNAYQALTTQEFSLGRRLKMLYHFFLSAPMARTLRPQGITHIHAHFLNASSSIAMYASKHSKIPFSITVHSAGTYKTPHIVGLHQKLQSAQFLAMISENNLRYFDSITPCADKSHIVRCGMDLDNFQLKPRPKNNSEQPIQLLAVGRLVEKKGFIHLINAAKILLDKGFSYQLDIIGDGPLMASLAAHKKQLQVSHVNLLGTKSTAAVHQAMVEADILIVPSVTSEGGEQEGLPVVIMEAMAIGTAVIASNHSGIPEIVVDGETGHLTEEKNAASIAKAIEKLCGNIDPQIISNAQQMVHETFNILSIAQQRLVLFKEASSHHGKANGL